MDLLATYAQMCRQLKLPYEPSAHTVFFLNLSLGVDFVQLIVHILSWSSSIRWVRKELRQIKTKEAYFLTINANNFGHLDLDRIRIHVDRFG